MLETVKRRRVPAGRNWLLGSTGITMIKSEELLTEHDSTLERPMTP